MTNIEYEKLRDEMREVLDYWESDIEDEDVKDFKNGLEICLEDQQDFLLYKYTPAGYYDFRNIENGVVHLNENGKLNDVYEGLEFEGVNKLTSKEAFALSHLAQISSFSECKSDMLMWSHYADSHRGMCIEYDLKKLQENSLKEVLSHMYPVVYRKQRKPICDFQGLMDEQKQMLDDIRDNNEHDDDGYMSVILPMMLVKGQEWENEKEWRLIYTIKDIYEEYKSEIATVQFDCISAIYLGFRFGKEQKKHILQIVQRLNQNGRDIKVFQAKLKESEYAIEYSEVKL